MNLFKNICTIPAAAIIIMVSGCKKDDNNKNSSLPVPAAAYFTANVQLNSNSPQSYACDEYNFEARVYPSGNDTLVFEGERSSDASYMYFNLITDDLYNFHSGDSVSIPYDLNGNEVFCSLLIQSLSSEIFQPYGAFVDSKVYIDSINYAEKYIKGRVHGKFYALNDTLTVTNGEFLIDL